MSEVSERSTQRKAPIRWWLVGLLSGALMPVCAWWAADVLIDVMFSLLAPPMCMLIAVAAVNAVVRWKFPRGALRSAELAMIYVCLSIGTAICAEWMVINTSIVVIGLAAEKSVWVKDNVLPHLPDWFYIKDGAVLRHFNSGGLPFTMVFREVGIWIKPIVAWSALFGLVCGAMSCINGLMRRHWIRSEKLSFPIIQVPMLLSQPDSPAWKSPFLWGGFVVMFAIDMLNGFSFLYPALPRIPVRFLANLNEWMPAAPWNAIGWTPIGLFPYMACIGLFMPSDLLFSCIFFFFFRKIVQIIMAWYGYPQGVFGGGGLVPSPPYFSEQTWGAFLGLFVGAVWASRGYLRELWGHIRAGSHFEPDDASPRAHFLGLVFCLGGLAAIGLWVNLSPWVVLGYIGVFLVFSTALTRLRAQVGPPSHEMAFMGPQQLFMAFGGSLFQPSGALTRLYFLAYFTNRLHRSHPMPHMPEAYKIGDQNGVRARQIAITILVTIVAALVVGQLVNYGHGYVRGHARHMTLWEPVGVAANLRQMIDQPTDTNPMAITMIVLGFCVVMLLDAIRFTLPGFPLHPAGYALALNFGLDYFWFGLLVALIVKTGVQKYTGIQGYDKLRMAAVGIIVAEFAAELIWSGMTMLTGDMTYTISINGRMGWDK